MYSGSFRYSKQKGQSDIVVMDFSKAFDKAVRQMLLLKLPRHLGVNEDVSSLVMPGIMSVLGPCLFLLYINAMPDTIQSN